MKEIRLKKPYSITLKVRQSRNVSFKLTILPKNKWTNSFFLPNSTNGGFFSVSVIRFSNLQISKKNTPNHYPELEIWISCLLLWAGISNFRFRIVICSNLFWRFEKRISLSEKKPPLSCISVNVSSGQRNLIKTFFIISQLQSRKFHWIFFGHVRST